MAMVRFAAQPPEEKLKILWRVRRGRASVCRANTGGPKPTVSLRAFETRLWRAFILAALAADRDLPPAAIEAA